MTVSRDTIFLTHDFAAAALHKGAAVLVVDLDDPRFANYRALPPTAEDISRAQSYGEAARATFFARRALLRHFLGKHLGCTAGEIIVGADASGAPMLLAPKQALFISIAGRGSFAAFAAASTPIGVDLEISGAPEEVPIAMLHENERITLADIDASADHKAFLELWTVKEAYLKARRLGLSREPSDIAVAFAEGAIVLLDRGMPVPTRAALCKTEPLRNDTLIIGCVLL